MRSPVVTAISADQTIMIAQDSAFGGTVGREFVVINAGMVPKLVADLMSAAVALGINLDYPVKPVTFQ